MTQRYPFSSSIDSSLIGNSILNGKLNLLETRQLSASQLHLLLHPTDDQDDADLKESNDLVRKFLDEVAKNNRKKNQK